MSKSFDCTKAVVNADGWLCLQVANVQMARQFVLDQKDKPFVCDLRDKRKSRSLTANAYMWALCEKLAEAIGSTKEEVYLNAVRDGGLFRDFHLDESEADSFCVAWRALGTGWPTEKVDYTEDGKIVIRAYYGSSVYSSKQMARLVDLIIQDCKAVGVETLPPDKLAALVVAHVPVKMGGDA